MVSSIFRGATQIVLALTALPQPLLLGRRSRSRSWVQAVRPLSWIDSGRASWSRQEEESSSSTRVEALCSASRNSEFGGRTWMAYSSRTFIRITWSAFRICG